MLDLGACLRYYKRPEIQKVLVDSAVDKEISVRYLDGGFGKRPDVLINYSDILENVKANASSFHCSEELWINPLQISTNMKKDEILRLRKGWDLVLDIDCPYWELSKITTWLFIEALKAHGIHSISLKFSGNKGFHIGVPFKAFPKTVPGKEIAMKDYFPDGPRRIAAYLVDYIRRNLISISDNSITFGNKITYTFDQLLQVTGKSIDDMTDKIAIKNGREVKVKAMPLQKQSFHFQCPACGNNEKFEEEKTIVSCKRCGSIMQELSTQKKQQTEQVFRRFNPLSIVEVDTVLIAPRHLYRMAYSMHEKSGLVSIPIAVERILLFEKDEAKPELVSISSNAFLDDSETVPGEASKLIQESFDWNPIIETEEDEKRIKKAFTAEGTEQITQKIPEELFPPCIKLLLQPLKDGKKRAMFILVNFLSSVGWNHDEISERIIDWNKSQEEPLRDNLIVTHLNYHKVQNKNVLPPNCPDHATAQYYRDMGVCQPDGLCRSIKNPVQYAKKRAWLVNQDIKKIKPAKTGIKKEPAAKEKIRCQSCGSPMGTFVVDTKKIDNFGTEKDNSKTKEYCSFCYQQGAFTDQKMTVDKMIALSIEHMMTDLQYTKEKAEELANSIIPTLKRWKQ